MRRTSVSLALQGIRAVLDLSHQRYCLPSVRHQQRLGHASRACTMGRKAEAGMLSPSMNSAMESEEEPHLRDKLRARMSPPKSWLLRKSVWIPSHHKYLAWHLSSTCGRPLRDPCLADAARPRRQTTPPSQAGVGAPSSRLRTNLRRAGGFRKGSPRPESLPWNPQASRLQGSRMQDRNR